jgi:hypothetical protein
MSLSLAKCPAHSCTPRHPGPDIPLIECTLCVYDWHHNEKGGIFRLKEEVEFAFKKGRGGIHQAICPRGDLSPTTYLVPDMPYLEGHVWLALQWRGGILIQTGFCLIVQRGQNSDSNKQNSYSLRRKSYSKRRNSFSKNPNSFSKRLNSYLNKRHSITTRRKSYSKKLNSCLNKQNSYSKRWYFRIRIRWRRYFYFKRWRYSYWNGECYSYSNGEAVFLFKG